MARFRQLLSPISKDKDKNQTINLKKAHEQQDPLLPNNQVYLSRQYETLQNRQKK